jgi:hypothetical protein
MATVPLIFKSSQQHTSIVRVEVEVAVPDWPIQKCSEFTDTSRGVVVTEGPGVGIPVRRL